MAKIYTKTGDQGYTSLTGGKRVKKNESMVEAYGTVDEANSMIGLALAKIDQNNELELLKNMLLNVQHDLFHVGAELSTPVGEKVYWPLYTKQIERLEQYIDKLDQELPPLQQFILPGGSEAGATLHLARTMIRRAERNAISIPQIKKETLAYLNRCSDFLFVAARWINMKSGKKENHFTPIQY
ncbi:cob(I)yrinic acid a,c-diamide adenosyltransferase [Tepidibacillus infernus]|uniref:cob(I)yrinic acid a,c-diamide adenosyltransferase n=1 Tax=Tepidibacillus infernus TaxID=1806172 RepID=UPI003B6CF716